jgi:uncharacterized protein
LRDFVQEHAGGATGALIEPGYIPEMLPPDYMTRLLKVLRVAFALWRRRIMRHPKPGDIPARSIELSPSTVRTIYRYPVKGLSAERLRSAVLYRGETLLGDRRYAIENGPSGFDPGTAAYLSKQHFLMLMKNERLACLETSYQDALLVINHDGCEAARGDLGTPNGRAAVERFFAAFCADELRGPPRVLEAPGHSFSDVARKVVSIINLASVAAIATMVGAPVDPLRFRGNLYVEGWPAFAELELLGRTLVIGAEARLKVVKRIVRCAATNVDPGSGQRDLDIPKTLLRTLGHADCGIYAEIIADGRVADGDTLTVTDV